MLHSVFYSVFQVALQREKTFSKSFFGNALQDSSILLMPLKS